MAMKPATPEAKRRMDGLYRALEQSAADLSDRLLAATTDPDPAVRFTAAYAFSKHVEPGALPVLIDMAESDPDRDVAYMALRSLSAYRDEAVHRLLLRHATRPHDRLFRVVLVRRLTDYDTPETIETLVALLNDEDAFVSTEAYEALMKLRPDERNRWERILEEH